MTNSADPDQFAKTGHVVLIKRKVKGVEKFCEILLKITLELPQYSLKSFFM